MLRIAIIAGSTRPNRKSAAAARWVREIAASRTDAEFEVVDLRQYHLPLLDEPEPASTGRYQHEHTRAWSETIAAFDGFIFVTPEYNHGTSAALEERYRLPLPRVEPQGGGLRQLWQRARRSCRRQP